MNFFYRKYIEIQILSCLLFLPIILLAQDIPKFRMDPAKSYGGVVSDYYSDVEYIPLETTKESLFGDVYQMIITDSSFVIRDKDTRSVLFFDKQGKYLNKVMKTGVGYLPSACFYNPLSKQIIVVLENENIDEFEKRFKTKTYTLGGKYICDLQPSDDLAEKVFSIYLDSSYRVITASPKSYYTQPSDTAENFYFWNVFKGDKYYKSVIPYDRKKNKTLLSFAGTIYKFSFPIVDANHSFCFSTPIDHNIYYVNKDTAIKKFQLIFPSVYHVDSNLLKITSREKVDSILQNRKWVKSDYILFLSNIIELKDKIIFKTNDDVSGLYNSRGTFICRNFVYNKIGGRLVAIEKITPDKASFYLPFFEPNIISSKGFLFNEGYFYTHISSLQMFSAKEKTKNKNPQYPLVLQQYFKTQNRKSNPVIVKMKLKE